MNQAPCACQEVCCGVAGCRTPCLWSRRAPDLSSLGSKHQNNRLEFKLPYVTPRRDSRDSVRTGDLVLLTGTSCRGTLRWSLQVVPQLGFLSWGYAVRNLPTHSGGASAVLDHLVKTCGTSGSRLAPNRFHPRLRGKIPPWPPRLRPAGCGLGSCVVSARPTNKALLRGFSAACEAPSVDAQRCAGTPCVFGEQGYSRSALLLAKPA
jgi:hypothetical protein